MSDAASNLSQGGRSSEPTAPTDSGRPHPRIPDYEVLRCIGSGAFGEVWLVRGVTGHFRAAKVVPRDRSGTAGHDREYKAIQTYAASSLEDPRLLKILHVGREPVSGGFYYIMELADDATTLAALEDPAEAASYRPRTLASELRRNPVMPTAELLNLGADLARSLHSLHSRGLVHRDIKPSNIVYIGGIPRLGDVGLVTLAQEARTHVGTQPYIPPEGPGKVTADIYALGKVLYEALHGRPVADFPSITRRDIPPSEAQQFGELNEIVLRAAAQREGDRYPSADALLKDLLLVASGSSVKGWLVLRRQLRWMRAAASVLAAVVVVAVVVVRAQRALMARAEARLTEATGRLNLARYTLAQTELAAGRPTKALEELMAFDPERRSLEWEMLHREAKGEARREFSVPGGQVFRLALSQDGATVAVLSGTNNLWIWSAGAMLPPERIENVLSLGSFEGTSQRPVWLEKSTHRIAGDLSDPGPWSGLQDTVDGTFRMLAVDSTLQTWVVRRSGTRGRESDRTVRVEPHHPNHTFDRWQLAPDGRSIFVQHYWKTDTNIYQRCVEQWSTETSTRIARWTNGDQIASMSVSADGSLVAMTFGTVTPPQILDTRTGVRQPLVADGLRSRANAVAFEPSGARVALGGIDGFLSIWNAVSGRLEEQRAGHHGAIDRLAWSADGSHLASAGADGQVFCWDMRRPVKPLTRIQGLWTQDLGNFLLGTSSGTWAAATTNGQVGVWTNLTSHQPHLTLAHAFDPLLFEDGDRVLWTLGKDTELRRWDLVSGKTTLRCGPLLPREAPAMQAFVAPQRQVAIAVGYQTGRPDYMVYTRWTLANPAPTDTQRIAGFSFHSQLSPDGSWLATLLSDSTVVRLSTDNLAIQWTATKSSEGDDHNGLAISSDGRLIAVGSRQGQVRILDAGSGQLVREFTRQTAPVSALAFAHREPVLVCAHDNACVTWVDTRSWAERATFRHDLGDSTVGKSPLWRLAFSHDDQCLTGLSNDSVLLRWMTDRVQGSR